jgi:hypothetical protein
MSDEDARQTFHMLHKAFSDAEMAWVRETEPAKKAALHARMQAIWARIEPLARIIAGQRSKS